MSFAGVVEGEFADGDMLAQSLFPMGPLSRCEAADTLAQDVFGCSLGPFGCTSHVFGVPLQCYLEVGARTAGHRRASCNEQYKNAGFTF